MTNRTDIATKAEGPASAGSAGARKGEGGPEGLERNAQGLAFVPTRKPPGERTPAAEAAVLEGLRRLLPLTQAAALGNVTRSAVNRWRQEDPEFDMRCRQAKAEAQAARLETIQRAGESNPALWASSAWILERTDPANFGRRDQVQVDVSLAGLVQASLEVVPAGAIRGPGGRFCRPDELGGQGAGLLPLGERPAIDVTHEDSAG